MRIYEKVTVYQFFSLLVTTTEI